MKRVIFFTYHLMPRKGAGSNYLEYLADAFIIQNYTVTIFAPFNNDEKLYYQNSLLSKAELLDISKILNRSGNSKKNLKSILEKKDLTNNDVIIYYGYKPYYLKLLYRLRKKNNCKVIGIPVEDFRLQDYEGNIVFKILRSLQYKYFYLLLNRADAVLPISHVIGDKISKSIPQLILPPLCDIGVRKNKSFNGKYSFIYPANGTQKDSVSTLLHVMSDIDSSLDFEFHITGLSEKQILKELGTINYKKIKNRLFIHDWMSYEELVLLYESVHYLILIREKNKTTISNFPSKIPEVMSHAIVPIVSEVGEYSLYYLTDNDNSLFIKTNQDAGEVIMKAIRLPYQEYNTISDNAYKYASEVFDYRARSVNIRNFIESL